MGILLTAEDAAAGGMGMLMLPYLIIMVAIFYFFLIRPQKKEQKRTAAMLAFYGIVIDITDDTIIVEFGSNKNCRIPMQKSAVAQIEKSDAE